MKRSAFGAISAVLGSGAMLTADDLRRSATVQEPAGIAWLRRAMLLSPFAVYAAAGFELAVLTSLLVATHTLRHALLAIVFDTSCLNAMKQDERGLTD